MKNDLEPSQQSWTVLDILDAIAADESMSAKAKNQHRQDITYGCSCIGKTPSEVSASPRELTRLLAQLSPGRLGVTLKRISNVRSAYRRGFACLTQGPGVNHSRGVSGPWRALKRLVSDRYNLMSVSRFAAFASANGISPTDVNDDSSQRYLTYMRDMEALTPRSPSTWWPMA